MNHKELKTTPATKYGSQSYKADCDELQVNTYNTFVFIDDKYEFNREKTLSINEDLSQNSARSVDFRYSLSELSLPREQKMNTQQIQLLRRSFREKLTKLSGVTDKRDFKELARIEWFRLVNDPVFKGGTGAQNDSMISLHDIDQLQFEPILLHGSEQKSILSMQESKLEIRKSFESISLQDVQILRTGLVKMFGEHNDAELCQLVEQQKNQKELWAQLQIITNSDKKRIETVYKNKFSRVYFTDTLTETDVASIKEYVQQVASQSRNVEKITKTILNGYSDRLLMEKDVQDVVYSTLQKMQ
ncbi:Hypothetical_protein [Hexamita inflata]|uniref:Hypothetical_protein n=1 Tax=Hexamita inflata TaxID=28002 RepID=A0AA86TU30_9EUKA|nr:Hypothetical protein HINF_LOCUS16396 [Hexamita inflata]